MSVEWSHLCVNVFLDFNHVLMWQVKHIKFLGYLWHIQYSLFFDT